VQNSEILAWLSALRWARRAALVAGVGAIALASADFVSVVRRPSPAAKELPAAVPAERRMRSLDEYEVIPRRALFAPLDAPYDPTGVDADAIAETSLHLRLLGTIVAGDPRASLAILEDSTGRSRVMRIGGRIGDARIEHIEREWVVVSERGRIRRISFDRTRALRARAEPERGPSRDAELALLAQGIRPPPAAPIQPASPRRGGGDEGALAGDWSDSLEIRTALAELGPQAASTLFDLSRQGQFQPQFGEGGTLAGISVGAVSPGSRLERLGLRSGDVVVSVAGNPLQSYSDLSALRGLQAQGFQVGLVRGGVPVTLQVPPGAL
jgi:type II secretory pathway component PulC